MEIGFNWQKWQDFDMGKSWLIMIDWLSVKKSIIAKIFSVDLTRTVGASSYILLKASTPHQSLNSHNYTLHSPDRWLHGYQMNKSLGFQVLFVQCILTEPHTKSWTRTDGDVKAGRCITQRWFHIAWDNQTSWISSLLPLWWTSLIPCHVQVFPSHQSLHMHEKSTSPHVGLIKQTQNTLPMAGENNSA